jgi:hypothetical protein
MVVWLLIGAILIASLMGALIVAENFGRRSTARHSMPWVDDGPAPRRTFQGQSSGGR